MDTTHIFDRQNHVLFVRMAGVVSARDVVSSLQAFADLQASRVACDYLGDYSQADFSSISSATLFGLAALANRLGVRFGELDSCVGKRAFVVSNANRQVVSRLFTGWLADPRHPHQFFDDLKSASEWLGLPAGWQPKPDPA